MIGLQYISTRGGSDHFDSAQAILKGIADNGGLFVPEEIPTITASWLEELATLSYRQRALAVLRLFLTDYSEAELQECLAAAYSSEKFSHDAVAPLTVLNHDSSILELWHGPTSAFKDMALQLLPQLVSTALKKTGETAQIAILTATSGDTGKAALAGFQDVKQTRIIVFYPHGGVSDIQRLQMVTQEGANVAVGAVEGNFDDTQNGVKAIFNDPDFNAELKKRGFHLSSANSINWGRLAPQIVYYFSAYADLINEGTISNGDKINFVVPTGNFGNILAGYYAWSMGLPVNKLICAANSNNVLADFLQTGTYDRNRPFHKTLSPSMDILISSNLERLLYHATEGDSQQVSAWMKQLADYGSYTIGRDLHTKLQGLFWASWADDTSTAAAINDVYSQYGYTCDPHTAVAWRVADEYRCQTGDETHVVIVSTASPFKFGDAVLSALGQKQPEGDEFSALEALSQFIGWPVPAPLSELAEKPILHQSVCSKGEMATFVRNILEK